MDLTTLWHTQSRRWNYDRLQKRYFHTHTWLHMAGYWTMILNMD